MEEKSEKSNKELIRKAFLRKRKLLGPNTFDHLNIMILDQVTSAFEFLPGTMAHVFLPILKNKEVNTWPIINYLVSQQVSVCVSKSSLEQNVMINYEYSSNTHIVENRWGIPEPQGGTEVNPLSIDYVFLPLVIFDRNGGRIGYGKGYYDRFLGACKVNVVKIGLSLAPPVDELPVEPHDIPLDFCVTPRKTYQF